jgi:hypothetical protein
LKFFGGTIYQVLNPITPLLCFAVSPTPRINPVHDENQFGSGKVKILRTQTLCVPSTKTIVKRVERRRT